MTKTAHQQLLRMQIKKVPKHYHLMCSIHIRLIINLKKNISQLKRSGNFEGKIQGQ